MTDNLLGKRNRGKRIVLKEYGKAGSRRIQKVVIILRQEKEGFRKKPVCEYIFGKIIAYFVWRN